VTIVPIDLIAGYEKKESFGGTFLKMKRKHLTNESFQPKIVQFEFNKVCRLGHGAVGRFEN
jgi:hypothetical protein